MTATITCAFHDAQVHSGFMFGRRLAYNVKVTVLDRYALIDVVCIEAFLQAGFELRTFGALNPERIAGNERFTEDDQLGTFFRALCDPVDKLGKSRIALEPDRSDLGQRDCERFLFDIFSRNSCGTKCPMLPARQDTRSCDRPAVPHQNYLQSSAHR